MLSKYVIVYNRSSGLRQCCYYSLYVKSSTSMLTGFKEDSKSAKYAELGLGKPGLISQPCGGSLLGDLWQVTLT